MRKNGKKAGCGDNNAQRAGWCSRFSFKTQQVTEETQKRLREIRFQVNFPLICVLKFVDWTLLVSNIPYVNLPIQALSPFSLKKSPPKPSIKLISFFFKNYIYIANYFYFFLKELDEQIHFGSITSIHLTLL